MQHPHCTNPIVHTIVAGDTLWSLAQRNNTTVESILEMNPGTEIYNLQIGAGLLICPGVTQVPPVEMPTFPPMPPVTPPIACLPPVDVLRELVMQNIRWIRDNFGDAHADRIIASICRESNRPTRPNDGSQNQNGVQFF